MANGVEQQVLQDWQQVNRNGGRAMRSRRVLALLSLCVTPLLGVALLHPAPASGDSRSGRAAVSTLLDWQRIAIDTVFIDGRIVVPPLPPTAPPAPVPVPVGTLFLG